MLNTLIVLLISYWLLHFTTKQIQIRVFSISLLSTKNTKLGIFLYSLILLPGTIIHELAHAITATILAVPVGAINIFPRNSSKNQYISMGHVEIAKTDFIRHSIIGFSPTLVGSSAIIAMIYYLDSSFFSIHSISQLTQSFFNISTHSQFSLFLILYIIFSIASSIHTSESDRESWPLFIVLLIVTTLTTYITVGFGFLNDQIIKSLNSVFSALSLAYIFSITINTLINLLLLAIQILISKLTGRKVVRTR